MIWLESEQSFSDDVSLQWQQKVGAATYWPSENKVNKVVLVKIIAMPIQDPKDVVHRLS